jgi:hypothetical protein
MKISYQVEKKYLFDDYEELVSSSSREWTLEEAIELAKDLQKNEKDPDAYYDIIVIGWDE